MPLDMSAIGREVGPSTVSWDSRDAMLYALGVGAGQADPYDELRFTRTRRATRSRCCRSTRSC
jgi:hypothetical protein